MIELVTKEATKQEYGGWKIAYKAKNVSSEPISDICLNATLYDENKDITGTISYTTKATVVPDQSVTVDIYVQDENTAFIRIESFYYGDSSGAYMEGKYTEDDFLALEVAEIETESEDVSQVESDTSNIQASDETNFEDITTPASDFLYATNNGEAVIRAYKGDAAKVVIPYDIDGNVVTTITEKAFYDNDSINSVTFPAGLKKIGDSAFSRCDNLTEVIFPKEKLEELVLEHECLYNNSASGELIIYARSLQIGPNAFGLAEYSDVILQCDSIVFQDKPFCNNPITTLYINLEAQITYDGHYGNSKTGDAFASMEDLEELYLPSSCSFLSENTFTGTPQVVVIGEEGTPWLQTAESLWIPTSTKGYAEKVEEVTTQLSEAGYILSGNDISDIPEETNSESQTEDNSFVSSTVGNTASSETNSSQTETSNYHTCEVDDCDREGTHVIEGLSGYSEWYCDDHYQEMVDILTMMEADVANSDASGKDSTSGNSTTGIVYDATLEYGNDDVMICISEDAMERFMSALAKDNQGTVSEMILSGEVAFTPKGTKCNIVTRKFTKAQVKLLDGDYAGNTVWVVIEALKEK